MWLILKPRVLTGSERSYRIFFSFFFFFRTFSERVDRRLSPIEHEQDGDAHSKTHPDLLPPGHRRAHGDAGSATAPPPHHEDRTFFNYLPKSCSRVCDWYKHRLVHNIDWTFAPRTGRRDRTTRINRDEQRFIIICERNDDFPRTAN